MEHCTKLFIFLVLLSCHVIIELSPLPRHTHLTPPLLKLQSNYIYSLSTSVFSGGVILYISYALSVGRTNLIELYSLTRSTTPYYGVTVKTLRVSPRCPHCVVLSVVSHPGVW